MTIHRSTLDGENGHDVVVAGRSAEYESLHPFDSRIDPSLPGFLLFSSKTGERDAIFIWDLKKRKAVGRYQFPGMVSILSPVWADSGHSIIFSGLAQSGVSDLYRLRLPDGRPEKLTDDVYQDLDPSVSPDSRAVAFASDRTAGGLHGAVNLFLLDLDTREIRQITSGPWVDETPRWEGDGRIYYASDRDRVLNIFSVDTLGNGRRETSVWTGVFDPDLRLDRHMLAAGAFHDLHWGIYLLPPDSAAQTDTFSLGPHAPAGAWRWPEPAPSGSLAESRQTLPAASHRGPCDGRGGLLIPGVGGAQGVQLYLSDLLGDQMLFLGLGTYQGQGLGQPVRQYQRLGGLPEPDASAELGRGRCTGSRGLPTPHPMSCPTGKRPRWAVLDCCSIPSIASTGSRPKASWNIPTARISISRPARRCAPEDSGGSAGSPPTS